MFSNWKALIRFIDDQRHLSALMVTAGLNLMLGR